MYGLRNVSTQMRVRQSWSRYIALTILELLVFNAPLSEWPVRCTDAQSDETIISAIHFVHLVEIIKWNYKLSFNISC